MSVNSDTSGGDVHAKSFSSQNNLAAQTSFFEQWDMTAMTSLKKKQRERLITQMSLVKNMGVMEDINLEADID